MLNNTNSKLISLKKNIDKLQKECNDIIKEIELYKEIKNKEEKLYYTEKRVTQDNINRGIFYKYTLKSIESEGLQTIFYCQNSSKIQQFRDMLDELLYDKTFKKHIKASANCKDRVEIIFYNDSVIKFVPCSKSTREKRYHFAVVDKDIDEEIFDIIIRPGIYYYMKKEKDLLEEYCNIEFVEM